MAWSTAALSASEQSWAALDLPFLSNNALYASGVSGGWDAGTINGTVVSATDDEDNFEASFAFDANPDTLTKPNAASTAHSLVFNCSSSPISFDWFALMNHNLYSLTTTQLRLQVSDDAAFTTRVSSPVTDNVSTTLSRDQRVAYLDLDAGGADPLRWSAVPYFRIQITCSSGTPYIGQVILGRRRQQPYAPDNPFDRLNLQSLSASAESVGGVITRNIRSLAPYHLDASFHHDTAALQTDADEFWDDIEGGEQPFFWNDYPNSDPHRFFMMNLDAPAFGYPYSQPNSRDWQIAATEQGHDTYFRDINGI